MYAQVILVALGLDQTYQIERLFITKDLSTLGPEIDLSRSSVVRLLDRLFLIGNLRIRSSSLLRTNHKSFEF